MRRNIAMTSAPAAENAAFFLDIIERWRRLSTRRHCLAEFDRFPAGLERAACDVELSRWEPCPVPAKWPDGADLIHLRLPALRLDHEPIASGRYGGPEISSACVRSAARADERDLAASAEGEAPRS